MTKHDTWVTLKPNNPISGIIHLFPDAQIPIRDPFITKVTTKKGNKAEVFVIDVERLTHFQFTQIFKLYASDLNLEEYEIFQIITSERGFFFNSEHVDKLYCGPEGYQRTREARDFYEQNPNATPLQVENFMRDQWARWIDGDEIPPPLPTRIEDVDSRLATPEMERALEEQAFEKQLANYSAFDVISGRAKVNILNNLHPDNNNEEPQLEELLED